MMLQHGEKQAWRSWLFLKTPALVQDPDSIQKSLDIPADVFVLDLEDSIPYEDKAITRKGLRELIPKLPSDRKFVVRINSIGQDGGQWVQDVDSVAHPHISALMLSKVEEVKEIRELDKILAGYERKLGLPDLYFKLLLILETPKAVGKAFELAGASQRNFALIHGSEDMNADLQCQRRSSTAILAADVTLIAARSAGILAIFEPDPDLESYSKFEQESIEAFHRGYHGRLTVTPKQTVLANKAFQPNTVEKTLATEVINLNHRGIKVFSRSVYESRQMIGPPHLKQARRLLSSVENMPSKPAEKDVEYVKPQFPPIEARTQEYQFGQIIESPYHVTIAPDTRSVWEQWFLTVTPLCTNKELSKSYGLDDVLVPFTYLMNLSISTMIIRFSQYAIVHLGIYEAKQHSPVYYGQTLKPQLHILECHERDLGKFLTTCHQLLDEQNKVVFSLKKQSLFSPGMFTLTNGAVADVVENAVIADKTLEDRIKQSTVLVPNVASRSLTSGELYVHRFVKTFTQSELFAMVNYMKFTNDHHGNVCRYKPEDLLVPGPIVVSAVLANIAYDFGEILYEEIGAGISVGKTNVGDMVTTISYIRHCLNVEENAGLEKLNIISLGIKNVDPEHLMTLQVPRELFSDQLKPRNIATICETHCFELYNRVVAYVSRTIIRAKP